MPVLSLRVGQAVGWVSAASPTRNREKSMVGLARLTHPTVLFSDLPQQADQPRHDHPQPRKNHVQQHSNASVLPDRHRTAGTSRSTGLPAMGKSSGSARPSVRSAPGRGARCGFVPAASGRFIA